MPVTTRHHLRTGKTEFEGLYRDLAQAWLAHQELKTSGATLADLADSSARLFKTRIAIAAWHRDHRR